MESCCPLTSSTLVMRTRFLFRIIDFCYRLLVRSTSTGAIINSAATGRRLWSFFLVPRPHRCRLILDWLPSREFNWWIMFLAYRTVSFPSVASRRRSPSLLRAVVGRRYIGLVPRAFIHGTALVCIRCLTRQRILYRWVLLQYVETTPSRF